MRSKSGQPDTSSGIILLCNKQLSKVPDDIPESPLYLDFSTNHIKNLDFTKDYNTLVSLHLNENPINKLDNVRFNNLRSLSLDFCNLTTMKQIPQLPNLISLSLVGNSLSSFENFHIFPNLIKIDLRGNLVTFTAVHTIAAVCSLRLSTINGRSVTEEEFRTAFSLSPIVGHALRKGRNPSPQEDEKAASLSFLSKENPLDIKNIGGCLVIRCPYEETSNVKWYQSSSNESEWELLDCTARTLPVTPMMYQRLIKCQYGNKSFYTPDIIQKDDSGRNCLSFTEQPAIMGSGTVGSILSLNSQQAFPTKINWRFSNSSESLGSCPVLIVPPEAGGQKIIAEIFPFSPLFEKVQFSPLTTEIQISNVQEIELIRLSIPDTIIEDEPFEIDYETYPSNSKLHFTIESSNSFESQYSPISNLKGKTVFTPSSFEVGKFLRVTTVVGDRQYSAYSKNPVEKVKACLKRSIICGENKTNHPHVFLFEFSDGVQASGFSQRWFVHDGASKEYISEERVVVPSDDCSHLTLGVDVTVWFDEGEKSDNYRREQSFTILSESPLEKSDKLNGLIEIEKEPVEDSKIAMPDTGQWFISDIHARDGFRAVIESDVYTPKASDIGKYIRFCSDESDVIIGPVLVSQSPIKSILLKSVTSKEEGDDIDDSKDDQLLNDLAVGSIVRAQLTFYNNRGISDFSSDELHIKWIRCSRASPEVVVQDGGNEYIVTYDDHGSKIKARIESTDWQKDSDLSPIIRRGEYSGQIIQGKPLIGSTLTLQFNTISPTSTNSNNSYHSSDSYNEPKTIRWFHNDESECLSEASSLMVKFIDVNHRIRVEINGKYNELTDIVSPSNVEEGQIIKFTDVFHRELTDKTGVLWFRYVFDESEWKEISAKRSYKLRKADVNSVIRVVSYQIHSDGSKTSEIFADIGPITAKSTTNDDSKKLPHSNSNDVVDEEDEEEETAETSEENRSKEAETKKSRNKQAKISYDEDAEYEEENDKKASKVTRTKNVNYNTNKSINTSTSANKVDTFDEYENEYEEEDYEEENNNNNGNENDNFSNNAHSNANEEEEEGDAIECHLQFTKYGQLVIIGDFDDDDDVKFFWRKWRGSHVSDIKDISSRKLTPNYSMVGYEIDGGFQTRTSIEVIWSNKVFIDHALPAPEATLDENGALVPGCVLECRTSSAPQYNPREQLLKMKHKIDKKRKKKKSQITSNASNATVVSEFDENATSSDDDDFDEEEEEIDDDFDLQIDESDVGEFQTLKIRFAWKRWDGMQFSRIMNDSPVYKVTEEDTDCYVCCDIYYVDKDGNHGPHTSVETSCPVSSEAVVIEGEEVVGSLLNAEGYDEFMKVCRFTWQRRTNSQENNNNNNDDDDDENWIVVGKKRTYRCSCDDVGKFVRVVCETKEERRISHEIGPIAMNVDIENKVKEILKNGSFKFKTKEQNGVRWTVDCSLQQFSITSKQASRSSPWKNVEARAAMSSDKKVEIFIGSFRVSVIPSLHRGSNANENEAGFDRDVCILALRSFKERAIQSASSYRKK